MNTCVKLFFHISVLLGVIGGTITIASDGGYAAYYDIQRTREARRMMAERIATDRELPLYPMYTHYFTSEDMESALNVHTVSFTDIPPDVQLDSNGQVVATSDFSINRHAVHNLRYMSLSDIQQALACSATITLNADACDDRTAFFMYHQLCCIRHGFNKVAGVIACLQQHPEWYAHDTRPISSLLLDDEHVLLRPHEVQQWQHVLSKEVAYRRYVLHNQPTESRLAYMQYWHDQYKSVAAHAFHIRSCVPQYKKLPMTALKRIDAYLDALSASPVVHYEIPRINDYDAITCIYNGHITSSCIWYQHLLPSQARYNRVRFLGGKA